MERPEIIIQNFAFMKRNLYIYNIGNYQEIKALYNMDNSLRDFPFTNTVPISWETADILD